MQTNLKRYRAEVSFNNKNNWIHLKLNLELFYKNELISVMAFLKENIFKGSKNKIDAWELNRFYNNPKYHIPGIANKLLSYFKKNYQWKEIFSYVDRRWSIGNLYYQLGFKFERKTQD